jgi:hypothetical protein
MNDPGGQDFSLMGNNARSAKGFIECDLVKQSPFMIIEGVKVRPQAITLSKTLQATISVL